MRQFSIAVAIPVDLIHDLQVFPHVTCPTVPEANHPDPAEETHGCGGCEKHKPEPKEYIDLLVE